jgi:hypothetical protein
MLLSSATINSPCRKDIRHIDVGTVIVNFHNRRNDDGNDNRSNNTQPRCCSNNLGFQKPRWSTAMLAGSSKMPRWSTAMLAGSAQKPRCSAAMLDNTARQLHVCRFLLLRSYSFGYCAHILCDNQPTLSL